MQRKRQRELDTSCDSDSESHDHNHGDQSTANEQEFTPRLVPLDLFLQRSTAAYADYDPLPQVRKGSNLVGIDLPRSLRFLLNVCTEILDISHDELYNTLLFVESAFLKGCVARMNKLIQYMCTYK